MTNAHDTEAVDAARHALLCMTAAERLRARPAVARAVKEFVEAAEPDDECDQCHNSPDHAAREDHAIARARRAAAATARLGHDAAAVGRAFAGAYVDHGGKLAPPERTLEDAARRSSLSKSTRSKAATAARAAEIRAARRKHRRRQRGSERHAVDVARALHRFYARVRPDAVDDLTIDAYRRHGGTKLDAPALLAKCREAGR